MWSLCSRDSNSTWRTRTRQPGGSRDSARHLLNAAAYTAVDKAESEAELANTVNAVAPRARWREELARSGGLMVHYSTDYVFDGTKAGPYTEDDPTGPLNVYGRSKLAGEQAIADSGCAHIILRTSWVYDTRGQNFLRRVLRLAREKDELRMVDDQQGAPTWARAIAEATAAIVAPIIRREGERPGCGEHGSEPVSITSRLRVPRPGLVLPRPFWKSTKSCWRGRRIPGEFSGPLLAKRVVSIASSEFKAAARRPANSCWAMASWNRVLASDFRTGSICCVLPCWRRFADNELYFYPRQTVIAVS